MFSVRQKREIADAVQRIIRETNHPELPEGEITFNLFYSRCLCLVLGSDPQQRSGAQPRHQPLERIPRQQATKRLIS